jgi:hypothetical protein
MTRSYLGWIWGSALVLLTSACGQPTPEEVKQRTSSILVEMIQETQDSVESARNTEAVRSLIDTLGWSWSGSDTIKADSWDSKEVAAQIDEALGKYIFVESNVEGSSSDSITFLLRGSTLCQDVEHSASRADCVEAVDRLGIRITATMVDADGVDLTIALGGGPGVVTLRLRPGSITAELDLAAARQAAIQLAALMETSLPDLPGVMEGVVSASLIRNAPGDLTAKVGILKAVRVEGATDRGAYKVRSQARDPLAMVRYQRASQALSASVDWGITEVLLPASEVLRESSGVLQVMVQGLSASVSTPSSGKKLEIKGLSLGQGKSWARLDGQTLVEVSLNPAVDGNSFDLGLFPEAGALPRCVVSPELDLTVKLHLAPLASSLDDLEPWALDDVYRLSLSSASGDPEVQPIGEQGGFPGGLKVLQGTLTLQSLGAPAPAKVSAAAGTCLVYDEQAPYGSHPLLGRLQVVPCP